ncbi:increased DNA methylation 3-like isoform X1 [Camellia sinensis]|uniref:increased DNA methylation 3-like isoform X1 n=2 Tax=Camellia sinensis TaxID=4442 RepID=UPI0010366EE4|nr:increased DNA methylation 3-like isoform X1 [Camellia sinensis]
MPAGPRVLDVTLISCEHWAQLIEIKFAKMNVEGCVVPEQLKPTVVLTGTAEEGRAGPPIGMMDIGVSEKAYLCRIALPGLRNNENNFTCDIQRDGRVNIHGVVTGGALKESSTAYEMKVQQLCPPGQFTISFNLPGPVDPRLASLNFRSDGILEIVIFKPRSTV